MNIFNKSLSQIYSIILIFNKQFIAEKLGFQKKAQIRKVRYYDSMKYGILRDEWKNICRN